MKFKLIVALILVLAGGVFLPYWRFSPKPQPSYFSIAKGEGRFSVAQRLARQKIIPEPIGFLLCSYLINTPIQAGGFRLLPTRNPCRIVPQLATGRIDLWLTIPEGWRVEQIAERIGKTFGIPQEEFLTLAKPKEGYLFPDTYLFPKSATPALIVAKMEENFNRHWQRLEPKAKRKKLSQKEVVILASLVEREAKFNQDRPEVAAVLLNRWRANWPLQVDATISYLLGKPNNWWPPVTPKDLKIDSPFNTYLYRGLPPAPICNPSFASLTSVVEAPKSEHWFYLSDKQGKIHFAKTYQQHQRNIQKYLKK